ncbi:isochorismatase family cysteine hydrolase [Clostridium sp.]|uniref:cysteine hydrolase family protein n=1 Tax=Clostridium sp. TaxID=1506 RepID=UPI00321719E0
MKKILIIIDCQNDFVTGSLGNEAAEQIIPSIVSLIKDFNGEIVFTRDTHDTNYLNTTEGRHLPVEHCIKGTIGHQIHRDLLGWKDAEIIDKHTFGSKDLIEHINKSIRGSYPSCELHIVGLCTDICVVSNALMIKSVFPEAKIIAHKNCCAGVDKAGHDAAMLVMERCHINIEE